MDWEFQFLNWIQTHLRGDLMDKIMPFITKFGDGGIFWIVLTLLLFIPKRTRKYAHVSAFALIFCVIGGNLILKNLIARPRPFWLENGNPLAMIGVKDLAARTYIRDGATVVPETRTIIKLLVKAPTDFAFPSGHTQASFAAATSICMWKRKWGIPALVLAALVAFSRLYLYVHYPTDVLGGLLFGVGYALLALAICDKLFRKKTWDGCEGARRKKRRKKKKQRPAPVAAAAGYGNDGYADDYDNAPAYDDAPVYDDEPVYDDAPAEDYADAPAYDDADYADEPVYDDAEYADEPAYDDGDYADESTFDDEDLANDYADDDAAYDDEPAE